MRTIPDIISKFGDIDVCMGIHGAGLANCVFGPPGVTVFEMQTRFHNFGFDSFMKVAHMAGGTHVMMDTEGMYNKKMGVVLQNETLTDIVDLLESIQSEDKALLLKRCVVPEVPDRGLMRSRGRPREMQGVQRDVMPPRLPPNSNDIKESQVRTVSSDSTGLMGVERSSFLIRLRRRELVWISTRWR